MSKEKYRAFCEEQSAIPVFSREWWLDAACGGAKYWDVLMAFAPKSGKALAAMPLYMPLKRVVSMPQYTQTMGVWIAPAPADMKEHTVLEQRQSLCKQLIDRLNAPRAFMQRFDYAFTDWLPFYWAGFSQTTNYTYLLRGIKDAERLREGMSVQTRRNIRRARDEFGIEVRIGVPFEEFVQVQDKTFERQGIKNRSDDSVLKRLIEVSRARGQGEVWGGYDAEGRLHAAAFVVWQSSSAYYIAGGGDAALRTSGAHSLVLWEAIRHVAQFTDVFDFEGSMLPGVERFFREFGAEQRPYFTISKGKMSFLERAAIKLRHHFVNKTMQTH
jgi:hypothetical protein